MARMTSLQDRATIDQLAQLGYTDSQIAAELGWKTRTVRKWRRRAQQNGRKSLASKMGRPPAGALSSYPVRLLETLRAWRDAHPGWGPKTLRAELEADEQFEGQRLPGLSSIADFLKEQFERLSEVKTCLDTLLNHRADARLAALQRGLHDALRSIQSDYSGLRQAADWLQHIADLLDPEGRPNRSGAEVKQALFARLDEIQPQSQSSPRLSRFYHSNFCGIAKKD